jgi:hypothetical protein
MGIANTVNDGDFAFIPQAFDRPHTRVKAKGMINGQDIFWRNLDRRAKIVVEPVGVWDNGVEAVVAATQLYNDKCFVSYGGRHSLPPLKGHDNHCDPNPLTELAVRSEMS